MRTFRRCFARVTVALPDCGRWLCESGPERAIDQVVDGREARLVPIGEVDRSGLAGAPEEWSVTEQVTMLEEHLNVIAAWEHTDDVAGIGMVESDSVPPGPHPRVDPIRSVGEVYQQSRCQVGYVLTVLGDLAHSRHDDR